MPSKKSQQRQTSPQPHPHDNTVREIQSSNMIRESQPSLKELLSFVPPYVSPARIWSKKIQLIWPRSNDAPTNLITALKLTLPASLFDKVSTSSFTSHLSLLDNICSLDSISPEQAANHLFESTGQLNKLPSEYFDEMKRLAHITFPEYADEIIQSIAWRKLIMVLPKTLQQTLALIPDQEGCVEPAKAVNSLDKAWKLQADTPSITATVSIPKDPSDIVMKALDDISSRLSMVEKSLQASDDRVNAVTRSSPRQSALRQAYTSDICWYHQTYGHKARRCTPPCRFQRRNQGN
jgi:hypothetical protein